MPLPKHGALGLSFLACRAMQFVSLIVMMGLTAHFISNMIDGSETPPPPVVAILCITCFAVLYIVISVILYWDQQLPFLPSAAADFLFFLALMITTIIVGKPLSALSCPAIGSASASSSSSSKSIFDVGSGGIVTDTKAATAATTTAAAAEATAAAVNVQAEAATVTAYTTVQTMVTQTAAYVAATLAPGTTEATVKGSDGQVYSVQNVARDASSAVLKAVEYDDWVSVSEKTCIMMKAVWGFGIALTILFIFTVFTAVFLWKRTRTPGLPKTKEVPSDDA